MNIVKGISYLFRKKWCVVNISDMGGGYAGQQYIIDNSHQSFDHLRYLLQLATITAKGKCHIYQNQIHKWFYTKRSAVKYATKHAKDHYFSYITNARYQEVPNIFAVCHLENTEENADTVTISNLRATKNNNPRLCRAYSVNTIPFSHTSHRLCPDNVWSHWSSAERYKKTLEQPDLFVITQI